MSVRACVAAFFFIAVSPVTTQLVHGESGLCWDASYAADDIIRNLADQFKAKAVSP